jgi:hypothetical protein
MLWVLRNHARNLYILKLQVPRDQADYELEHTRHNNNNNNNSAMLYVLGLRASWINYWGYNTGDVDGENHENPCSSSPPAT